ncbi:MAG: ATP-binding protein [Bacteroidales bacterium]|nr:ATP-binding protein [Bacteroidales bacterium]
MNKELVRNIIVENQQLIQTIKLVERPFEFEERGNYVFVGVRQAGKSYMLFQRAQQLLQKGYDIDQIVYISFDDERINEIQSNELDIILQAQRLLSDKQPVLFLDEIQNIDGWEHFARRLANEKYTVYITGSNAKMLSRDIQTILGGRYWDIMVYPFSFKEYLKAAGVTLEKNWQYGKNQGKIARIFDGYFYFGGFPELLEIKAKRQWLTNIYNKIFFSDIIVRNGVRNEEALRISVKRLASCVMQPTSFNRIANLIKSTGITVNPSTVSNFVQYLRDACLMFSIENYADKFVEKQTTKKHYFVDNGILNLFLTNPDTALLENLTAIFLYQKFGNALYYYNKNIEVDFFVPDNSLGVQVSYNMDDESTKKREIKALTVLNEYIPLNEAVIITKDTEETISVEGLEIKIIPIWKYILE